MHTSNLGHIYYILIIVPYLILFKGLWLIGLPLIVMNFFLYFFGKDMRLFKKSIASFNIFFFGINIILGMSVITLSVFRPHDALIAVIVFISILATSGFYYRMVKVGKAEKKNGN